MRTQAKLAELYRRVGRDEKAPAIEAELLKLLKYADPDYPLLQDLRARQSPAPPTPAEAGR